MSRLPFARQMLVLQIAVVLIVVALATVTYGVLTANANRANAEETALAIARTVAQSTDIRQAATDASAAAELGTPLSPDDLAAGIAQRIANDMRSSTAALFVVVTDARGIRIAHPDTAQLGLRVSTDPAAALAGREATSWESGTLGESARAKVPIVSADAPSTGGAAGSLVDPATVVGEVSVGFGAATLASLLGTDLVGIAVVAVLALGLGIAASAVLSRRLTRLTLGLQPAELAGMVQDQSAVLNGIGEGVLACSPDGTVTVCNSRAAYLLSLPDPVGTPVAHLALPRELLRAIETADDADTPRHLRVHHNGRLLFLDVARVRRDTIDLGTVVVARDETDLESLTRQLTAVSAMTTALRVQKHEFANRLHVISGLLATDRIGEAMDYLSDVLDHGPVTYPVEQANLLTEPYLQALIGAKAIEARERGVTLRIGDGTLVRGVVNRPEETTTVLGNLLDNAISAAVDGARDDRWVEIEALDDGADLHLAVSDSGDGIPDGRDVWASESRQQPTVPPDAVEAFAAVSRARGFGFGLPLSREIARRRGGDVWVADTGSDHAGAVFCARLVGVIESPDVIDASDQENPHE